jgi:hypothetical protein
VIYWKASESGRRPDEPLRSWGRFTRHLEIGDDSYALRHVDLYENGHLLRYDRTHWVDKFGTLSAMAYDERKWEEWWGPASPIEPAEFKAIWHAADTSPLWQMQLRGALMSRLGPLPIWLQGRSRASGG